MLALRLTHFGAPEVLRVIETADPVAKAGEAVIRVEAASVNPSDVKNVAGDMDWTILPRTPGRDFGGVVVSGPAEWQGVSVWGTGGDLGFTRDGSHAQLMAVPMQSLVRKPERLTFDQAAAIGVNFVVAWQGLVEIAQVAAGETVAVFGVTGGVGGAVAQIAHALGANVIGVGRRPPARDTPAAEVIDDFIDFDTASAAGVAADVVYDAVGGVTTAAALSALAPGGRLVVISVVGEPTVEINLRDLYHNQTRILGVDSGKLGVVDSAERLERMRPYFESGAFRPLPIAAIYPLDKAVAAYRAVADHTAGRVVIRPR